MTEKTKEILASALIQTHFGSRSANDLASVTKIFPTVVRPDLEAAIDGVLSEHASMVAFSGVSDPDHFGAISFSRILMNKRDPIVVSPPEYMDIDIGGDSAGRCVESGLWLFKHQAGPAALIVSQIPRFEGNPGVRVEVIMSGDSGGRDRGQTLLADISKRLTTASVYRGRALSFETTRSYSGGLGALKVHRFSAVGLADLILPANLIDLLQRTVFGFVSAREALRKQGFSVKRGILLYGPPGTGKTHFIRYLLSNLPNHTSLIVTAEQVAYFDHIMSIARALQPAIVVIEDADLIARQREDRDGDCSQMLLNSLLNHMDGLTDEAEILFILTTNRPDNLEAAVRDRPGRIDQAIEIPKPDADCRERLLRLYRGKMSIPDAVVAECVRRTESASAAFMRELARRMAQFAILRGDTAMDQSDMRLAFEEMIGGGPLTLRALGADGLS